MVAKSIACSALANFHPLRPFPADEMEAFEVSKDVGNVKNNSPEPSKEGENRKTTHCGSE